jgi:uncharacterized lipoprotein
MKLRNSALLAGVLAVVGLSAGCGLFKTEIDKCHEQREYQAAKPGPRVRIPADLNSLSEETWVPVPYGDTDTEATPDNEPCLIEPPEYRT